MFKIKNIHHIKLTASNLGISKQFYRKLPGFNLVAEYSNFVMFYTGSFYLGLTDHNQQIITNRFDEKNVGMDHVSFEVRSKKDLEDALIFFDKEKIEHGTIKKLSNNLYVLAFRDPDNIQLELSWKEND